MLAADEVRLLFTTNVRQDRLGAELTVADVAGLTDAATYTVVDRVSVINRFGSRWALKGQSGRITNVTADNPAANLVSMYRKRSTTDAKDGYKYKDNGDPDGDAFKDGTDGDQWIASVGRINMSGAFVGTPGEVQQDDGGQVVSAKDPASLPVGSVIINEIFNSDGLQWVELHNTGTAAVNVKKYELDAVTPKDGDESGTQQRVFAIPDKDANIPAGGFLVITNRQPADSILAGGVDLHDSNKFPAGASQLYIVIEEAGDNKWMPEKGFLLVLRSEAKDNHDKIVDIAGNAFDTVVSDTIVTDVWPLKGWTVPGDRLDNSFGDAANSLGQNTGKTYARDAQKSQANRLHKGDWLDNGAGPVGGLGYDPGVTWRLHRGHPVMRITLRKRILLTSRVKWSSVRLCMMRVPTATSCSGLSFTTLQ